MKHVARCDYRSRLQDLLDHFELGRARAFFLLLQWPVLLDPLFAITPHPRAQPKNRIKRQQQQQLMAGRHRTIWTTTRAGET
jgi:hypothetical protein